MNPGRELDALIAEKVFGLSIWNCPNLGPLIRRNGGVDDLWYEYLKEYSTSIEAAWEVYEKVLREYWLGYYIRPCVWDRSTFPDGTPDNVVEGESIPHAICLAALKAVGNKFT